MIRGLTSALSDGRSSPSATEMIANRRGMSVQCFSSSRKLDVSLRVKASSFNSFSKHIREFNISIVFSKGRITRQTRQRRGLNKEVKIVFPTLQSLTSCLTRANCKTTETQSTRRIYWDQFPVDQGGPQSIHC